MDYQPLTLRHPRSDRFGQKWTSMARGFADDANQQTRNDDNE